MRELACGPLVGKLRRDQTEVFKILNGYENIHRNICSHSRKIVELEDMR